MEASEFGIPEADATIHTPILVAPIVEALLEPLRRARPDSSNEPTWLVDATLGGGGHTGALLAALEAEPALNAHRVLAVDQDPSAVERAGRRFAAEIASGRLEVKRARFSELEPELRSRRVMGLLADLGFSSDQLGDPSRGLSFQSDGPLDMRLDPARGQSCRDLLNRVSEAELQKILSEWGEERFAGRIARTLIEARRARELPKTTRELSDLIVRAVPPPARHGRIHAATRTFQALRIAVNDEMGELDSLLGRVILSVSPGGRVAILSFHSLEDRRVKQAFKENDSGRFRPLTKKPLEAPESEQAANPRSRSAKLRLAEALPLGERGAR